MATLTDRDSVNATLSGTTVDTVTLTGRWRTIEVYNREPALTGDMIWFTINGSAPVAEAEGAIPVPAGTAREIDVFLPDAGHDPDPIKVLGNGNDYTVAGVKR